MRFLRVAMTMVLGLAACTGGGPIIADGRPDSDLTPDANTTIDADTTVPDTFLDATPNAATNQIAATFTFHSDDSTASFECSLDGAAQAACTSGQSWTVAEGAHTFSVAAIDPAGNEDQTPATFAWTVDTTPPDTTLTKTPPALDNSVDVELDFTSEDGATFECSLDGAAFATCGSPDLLAGLTAGVHTFDVRAIDAVGNVDPTPAHYAWTIDTSTPDTVIDAGPAGAVSAATATFVFSSPNAGAGATFACSLDGAAPATCTSPIMYDGLAEAMHVFTVQVTNAAGTSDPTPASRAWTVDLTAPAVAITSGPSGPTSVAAPSFAFTVDGAPISVQCQMDGAAAADCTSPYASAALADGPHTFRVTATDAAGNIGAATRAFTVDTQAPTVAITGGPSGPTNDATPAFTFTTAGNPIDVECAIDNAGFAPCASPYTAAALADGAHEFDVRAVDAAGNAGSASRMFTVDTVAPTVAITGGPTGLTNVAAPIFTFTTAGSPTSVQCKLDGGAYAACTSPFTAPTLADGAHTFAVQVADAAGNSSSASRSFTVDATPPTVAITGGPTGLTNVAAPTFTFTTGGSPTTIQCAIDGAVPTACTSPITTAPQADGAHTFTVTATDAAGNSASASRAFTVDATPPTVAITGGPTGLTNDNTPTFTFTTGGNPTTIQCAIDAAAPTACTSPITTATLADGAHSFAVTATDAAGNSASASRAFTVDATPPTVAITGGPTGLTNVAAPTFTFTTGGSPTTIQCAIDGAVPTACTSPITTAPQADGAHSFAVTATDAAGNSASASRAFTVDATPPTVAITGGPTGLTNDSTPTFTFTTGGNPTTIQCAIDAAAPAACTSPITTATLADGAHTFAVTATDAAGNSASASRTFTVDATPPTVAITGGPTGLTNDNTPTFTFTTGGSPTTIQCAIDGAVPTACTSPITTATLADGAHSFAVTATDAAGNSASASRAFTVDATPPTVAITGGPTGLTNDSTPTFTFTTGGNPTTIQCAIDAAAPAACTSPITTATLADGAHSFAVTATDAAGNSASASRAFTVDATPPTVAITGGPTGLTNVAAPTFTFTTGGSPTTIQCAIDGAVPTACTSPITTAPQADGAHTFTVTATDAAGNSASASRAFTVDATPPTVAITGGPTGLTNDSTPTFTFTTGGNPTTIQCAIDAAAPAACTSPITTATLADGAHSFAVTATDAAGNSASASRAFTVDATPPTVSITGGPTGLTNNASPIFTFTTGGNPTTTQCRIGSGTFTACTGTYAPTAALADGTYVFEVQVVDAAGNSASATRGFTVDATPPTVTITGGPTGLTNDSTPTFTFTTGGSPTTTQCRFNGGTFVACATSFMPTTALADGSYTFEVQVVDAAGNIGDATRGFSIDATPPTVAITGGPTGTTNNAQPTFTFTTGGSPTTVQCRFNTGAFAACTSPFTPSAALPDGGYTFDVQVIDAAGNSAEATRSFTIDTRVTITGSASPAAAASLTASVGGTACTSNACVVALGTKVHLALAPLPAWSFSGWTGTVVGCTGTALAIDVTAGTLSSSCTANLAQLTVALTAQPDAITPLTATHFAFTRSAAVTSVMCSVDGSPAVACTGATTQDYTNMGPGTHTFALYGADAAGAKSATVTASWVQHVDDGHIVIMGHDFHNVVAPYGGGTLIAQTLLVNAIQLGRPSPTTNKVEALFFAKAPTTLAVNEIANIKAAVAAASSTIHFTDLTATDAPTLTAALIGKSVLVIPDQTDHGAAALGTAWAQPLGDFVRRGGVVVVLDGADATGSADTTGLIMVPTGLIQYSPSFVLSAGTDISISPWLDAPLTGGLSGTYTLDGTVDFHTNAGAVVLGPPPICGSKACTQPIVVAHLAVHTVERFDYNTGAFPWGDWMAASPAAIAVDTTNAHDETRGATGGAGAGNALNSIAWAWRTDVSPIPQTTVSEWVRFTNPGTGKASYGGLGVGAQPSGIPSAVVALAFNGVVALEPGGVNVGTGAFTPDLSITIPSAAVTYNAWYQLTLATAPGGASYTATLYDAAGNLILSVNPKIAQTYAGGIAIGVSAGATIDSITFQDAPELSPLEGGSESDYFQAACPDGEVMIGAQGMMGDAIDSITAIHCGRIVRDSAHASGYHIQVMADVAGGGGAGGAGPWNDTCPNDGIVVGITVGVATDYGTMYGVQLQCETMALTGSPGTYQLEAGAITSLPMRGDAHAGLTYSTPTFFADPAHAVVGIIGYYGPWPTFPSIITTNGLFILADRPWIQY